RRKLTLRSVHLVKNIAVSTEREGIGRTLCPRLKQPVAKLARLIKLAHVKLRFHFGKRSLIALMFFDRSSIARIIQLTVIRVIYPAIGLCHGRMGKLHLVIFFKKTGQTGINITLGCGWCYGVRLRRSWSSAGTGD